MKQYIIATLALVLITLGVALLTLSYGNATRVTDPPTQTDEH